MNAPSRRGVHAEIVEVLGQRIISGQIPEGATVNLVALEEELDVSLTAIREALKVLMAKGLVDARQKRGTFVNVRKHWHLLDADIIRWRFASNVDETFLDQLDEVRQIIEPAVVRLAVQRRTDADLEALDRALGLMAAADGAEQAVAADLAFHRALLRAAHNELLEQMEVVLEAALAQRDQIVHSASDADDAVPSHAAVFRAIRKGSPRAAEAAVRALLGKARADIRQIAAAENADDGTAK